MATGILQYVFLLDMHRFLVLQNILMNSQSRHSFMSLLRLQRRLVAAMTLTIIMTLLVSVDCHAVGPKDAGLHATTSVVLPATEHPDSPCCPIDDHGHTDVDHCLSCLHCACNAPLAALETILSYAPSLSLLNPINRFNLLPEVYLPIFIPPQNLS
jgi:hypothetical protein